MPSPTSLGPESEQPLPRRAALNDAIEAFSAFEQFFVLSYRTSEGSPILVTELSIPSASVLGVAPDKVAIDPGAFARLLHPDDRDRVLAEHWDAVAAGRALSSEYRMVGQSGNILWIYDQAVTVTDAGGTTTLYGHCLDI